AEELLGPLDRQALDDVDELAAAVVAPAGIALGVLVGHHAAGRLQHGAADEVLGGDQLQAEVLARALVGDGLVNLGIDGLQRTVVGHLGLLEREKAVPEGLASGDRWRGLDKDGGGRAGSGALRLLRAGLAAFGLFHGGGFFRRGFFRRRPLRLRFLCRRCFGGLLLHLLHRRYGGLLRGGLRGGFFRRLLRACRGRSRG